MNQPIVEGEFRILFMDRGEASYIERDLLILSATASVTRYSFLARRPLALFGAWFKQLVLCMKELRRAHLLIVHFAGWNSILPVLMAKLFDRPSVLFLHGTDAVAIPEVDYGNFRKWPLSLVTELSLKWAARVVVVDDSLVFSRNGFFQGPSSEQGILQFVPELKTPVDVIPHGFDPDTWKPTFGYKDIDILTVGSGFEDSRLRKLKGVDRFLVAARLCPDLRFVIIGWDARETKDIPANVSILPKVCHGELPSYYQRSKCYAQLSLSEGFGCALVEAMFCGCVPVVNAVGAMPGIVAGQGVVLQTGSDSEVVKGLRKALDSHAIGIGQEIAFHARRTYPIALRRDRILDLVRRMACSPRTGAA
jgi:glycosyltransferase involved in cell wall biosynthesis